MSSASSGGSAGRCDRRAFVGLCAAAALGPVLSGCAALVVRPVTPVDGRIELPLRHHPELLEPGGSLRVQPVDTDELIDVLVLDDGGHAALSPICTHLGCTIDVHGARLVCPCHGSTYDRAGRVLQGPAERALARYRVERTADDVLVIHLMERS